MRRKQLPAMFPAFNRVVMEMARDVSYTLTQDAYADFAEMRADAKRRGGVFSVNTNYSEHTIFGEARVNWAFRAWHDICHLLEDADFSEKGELAATECMIEQMFSRYGETAQTYFWAIVIRIEVMGQFRAYQEFGSFVPDQRAFMVSELAAKGLASTEVGQWIK